MDGVLIPLDNVCFACCLVGLWSVKPAYMNFGLKVFKVLTGINLFTTGFLLLMIFLSAFVQGFAPAIISGFLIAGIFIHSIFSAYLQRSLVEPGFTLKENTPGGIFFLSIFSISMGLIFLWQAFLMTMPDYTAAIRETFFNVQDDKKIPQSAVDATLDIVQFFMTSYGITIVANAILSLIFLQEWKKRQQSDEDTDPDIDGDA